MAKITKETVQKVAKLASLELNDGELKKITEKFASVLGYVEKLNGVDTRSVSAASHAIDDMSAPLREDIVEKFDSVDGILKNVPKTHGRLVEVPKVLENT